jgi:energy-coupling factor transporter ATP-binding protein EcfA2
VIVNSSPAVNTQRTLHIEDAGMVFPTRRGPFVALRDINLDINRGEFVTLIGHSGCGKSTLLNLVAGLTAPTSGVLLLEERVGAAQRVAQVVLDSAPQRVRTQRGPAVFVIDHNRRGGVGQCRRRESVNGFAHFPLPGLHDDVRRVSHRRGVSAPRSGNRTVNRPRSQFTVTR